MDTHIADMLAKLYVTYNLQTRTMALLAECCNVPIRKNKIWDIVQAGDLEKFKLINKTNLDIPGLLKIAVCNDHLEIVKYMMNLWNIDPDEFYIHTFKDERILTVIECTLSWIASFNGSVNILKYLIDIKANIKKQYEDEYRLRDIESPLYIAQSNNQTEIIELFAKFEFPKI